MDLISIDIETYSDVDLLDCGVYRYVDSPNFEILLFAYSYNYGKVRIIDFTKETIPPKLADLLLDPNVIKTAYNANFERVCLARYLGIDLKIEQWSCTAVLASTLGLPPKLGQVAEALGFPDDKKKSTKGKVLIKYFCVPCKPSKTNRERTRNLPEHAPEKWEDFKSYCIQDVVVENEIRNKLAKYDLADFEKRLYALDQRINDKGIKADIVIAHNAIECSKLVTNELLKQATELTGINNPNSVAQIKAWLLSEADLEVESLNKKALPGILNDLKDDEKALSLMAIRAEISKTSIKKYDAIVRSICKDGNICGLLKFCGAGRTGRWSGSILQVQNLKKTDDDFEEYIVDARHMVKNSQYDAIEVMYGSTQKVLSQLIRSTLIPDTECKFIISDFSAIEARVLAWLASERWRMEVFATHGKIYEASASQMFKVPLASIDKKSPLRQKGKVAELACIAEGQLILTDTGLIPVEKVEKSHKLWDGIEWVSHEGVIYKGEREVITYYGLTATRDHKIYTTLYGAMDFGCAAHMRARPVETGSGELNYKISDCIKIKY